MVYPIPDSEAPIPLIRSRRYTEADRSQNRMDPKLKLHQGPFKIVSYDKANGTLQIRRGNYIEPINVRLVRPFFRR